MPTEALARETETQHRGTADEKVMLFQLAQIDVGQPDGITEAEDRRPRDHLLDPRARVVRIAFLKADRVHHDPAFNVSRDHFAFVVDKERPSFISSVVDAHQVDESATIFDQVASSLFILWMIL